MILPNYQQYVWSELYTFFPTLSSFSFSHNKYFCNYSCATVWHFGSFFRSFHTVTLIGNYWIPLQCRNCFHLCGQSTSVCDAQSSDFFICGIKTLGTVMSHCCTENRPVHAQYATRRDQCKWELQFQEAVIGSGSVINVISTVGFLSLRVCVFPSHL